MKSVNAAVRDAIRESHAVFALPRLTVEWNFNRYAVVSADNTPTEDSEGYDVEVFPIESIYAGNRPTRGVAKLRINEGRISNHDANPLDTRYYLGGVDDVYKYWSSPVETDGTRNFPNHTDGATKCRPHIKYTALVSSNKIVINWENSWATPEVYTIWIQETVGGAWEQLAGGSWVVNSKGQTILYHHGSDVWLQARPVDGDGRLVTNLRTLAGVQARVETLGPGLGVYPGTGASSFCNVIEISARREEDLTDRLISNGDTFDMADKSNLYPMGTLTSNTGSITLSNLDGILSKDSDDDYFRWLIEPGAIFNLEYVYNVEGTKYPVQQFKMYGGPWSGQRDDTVNIELTDFSKYLKEARPNPCFYEGLPVTQIIWRLCDSVGFVDYAIQSNDLVSNHVIPYFWADGEKTVWELFDELSKATQTAIYFDGSGLLQIKTREAMFDEAKSVDWVLRADTVTTGPQAGELADIVTLDQTDELESNHITINYQNTTISDFNNGIPKLEKVWEAEGTTVLRSSQLTRPINTDESYVFYINAKEAVYWPYQGIVQIEGELIRYKSKNYVYYDNGVRTGANIKNVAEKAKCDNKTFASQKHLNGFSGGLIIDDQASVESGPGEVPGRGLWNSVRMRHEMNASNYEARARYSGITDSAASSFRHDAQNSMVTLDAGARFKNWYDLCAVTRGSYLSDGYYYYGTKLRFEKAGKRVQRAGMVIHSNASENGYYIELTPTNKLTATGRKLTNELIVYSRKSDQIKIHGGTANTGVPINIVEGVWYEMDVFVGPATGGHTVSVWINGNLMLTVAMVDDWYNIWNGRFGMHFRGQTKVSYEYLYAIGQPDVNPIDNTGFYDRVEGGYQGNQWDREWVYGWKTKYRRTKKGVTAYKVQAQQRFMDEFGPIVHEVREFDIKFDPKPVLHSQLYMTNDWQVICPEYTSNAFGAKFYLANTSRENAIIHGEDNLTYANNTINQVFAVYGRAVTQSEAEKVISQNYNQILRRGKIETELSSPWVQSKAAAQDIADWMLHHWGETADEQTVEIFGNPLLEIGDVVTVSYPEKSMVIATHKYFITAVSTSFDQGLATTLVLRRVLGV